jgi:hypothetical protein
MLRRMIEGGRLPRKREKGGSQAKRTAVSAVAAAA